ncbi:DsbA family protein [Candidatus Peregrinibacteria bacterium]|nr:DsbA family protein [Candidatus Peregrinibacteria bacterium]
MGEKKNRTDHLWKYSTILLAGLLIGYIIGRFELTTVNFVLNPQGSEAKNTNTTAEDKKEDTASAQNPVDVNIEGDLILGKDDATITLIDFSDFECPFSKKFYTEIFADLKRDFIDTGKVKYIFKDYPLNLHPNALPAAIAAECAGQQNKYWEMHNKIFDTQTVWSGLENADETFKTYAGEIGLNLTKYTDCTGLQSIKDEIYSDREDGINAGARSTPTLFINGMILRGVPQSYDQLKQYLESQLGN